MSESLQEKRLFSRKSHRKSRHGCGNCKRRRVKCDEAKPCSNCTRHSIECDFLTPQLSSSNQRGARNSRASARTFRFVDSNRRSALSKSPSTTTDPEPSSLASQSPISSPFPGPDQPPLSYDDFALLHHYLTSASCTFGEGDHFWRVMIPEIGFKFHFVLHFFLSLSALHLGREKPDLKRKYNLQAEEHYLTALSRVTPLLSHMDSHNCQALYVSGMLICFHHFAKGPQPGDYLLFSEHGRAEWSGLVRGVRSIIDAMRNEFASEIPHGPPKSPSQQQNQPFDHIPTQYQEQMLQLCQFVSDQAARSSDSQVCVQAVERLSQSFTAVYGGFREVDTFSPRVFGWLYLLSEEFCSCLQEKQPVALIIFAHFCVLLKELEVDVLWFMKGWSRHIIEGINRHLSEDDKAWIRWPLEQLEYSVE